jgi:hypothetical protein
MSAAICVSSSAVLACGSTAIDSTAQVQFCQGAVIGLFSGKLQQQQLLVLVLVLVLHMPAHIHKATGMHVCSTVSGHATCCALYAAYAHTLKPL